MKTIAILHTGLRQDEKLLIAAAEKRGVKVHLIDMRKTVLDPENVAEWQGYDVILERCIPTTKGNAAIEFLTNLEVNVVNNANLAAICNDKFATATLLSAAGVPVLRSFLVFDEGGALSAIESLGGYPIVIKSRSGSWGRLMTKVTDKHSLESVFEHRKYMGPEQSVVLIQEFIEKERDIRAFVIDGKCICAIYRSSDHWITNISRGGQVSNCEVTEDLAEICAAASETVGGGVLALDVMETTQGLKVNEINHTMEFKNSETPTGISISEAIIDYTLRVANSKFYPKDSTKT